MSKMSQKVADALADAAPTMLNALERIVVATTATISPYGGLPRRIRIIAEAAIKEAHKL